MNGLNAAVTQMAYDALEIGLGRLIGWGMEAARAAQMARAEICTCISDKQKYDTRDD
jgi:hypothetical protein